MYTFFSCVNIYIFIQLNSNLNMCVYGCDSVWFSNKEIEKHRNNNNNSTYFSRDKKISKAFTIFFLSDSCKKALMCLLFSDSAGIYVPKYLMWLATEKMAWLSGIRCRRQASLSSQIHPLSAKHKTVPFLSRRFIFWQPARRSLAPLTVCAEFLRVWFIVVCRRTGIRKRRCCAWASVVAASFNFHAALRLWNLVRDEAEAPIHAQVSRQNSLLADADTEQLSFCCFTSPLAAHKALAWPKVISYSACRRSRGWGNTKQKLCIFSE